MARSAKRPESPPGLNIWLLRELNRGWTYDDLGAAIKRATGRTYTRPTLWKAEQQNSYSSESIAAIAAGLGVPLWILFAPAEYLPYADMTPEGRQRVTDYIAEIAGVYRT